MQHAIDPPESDGRSAISKLAWLDERLGLAAFYRKYGRKAFPVHHSFFFGEMALFAFVILVATGIYLGLIYAPSNVEITVDGETVPEAYASVRLIESIPVANLFRSVHHWAAHLMIASIFLHVIRIYFTGTYRKPREVNWVIGVTLLGLTLMAGFVGYALPYDSYAVTATGIGYSIARSIPWVGDVAAELFFGGAFPTLGSIPRLYTIHVFVVPALIAMVVSIHLLIIVKQKHTQPGYARAVAEPGRVLGVPLWPYQALLAGQLLMLMFGALFLLSAVVPPHPLDDFGPPGPASPEVKPDWYLLWIYGFLKIVPSEASFDLFGATIGPNFIGGLLFPGFLFGLITLAPWLDRTNRRAVRRFEYLEPATQRPARFAAGLVVLTLLGTLFLAAFYDEIDMTLSQIWAVVIGAPLLVGVVSYVFAARKAPFRRFDPTSADRPAVRSPILDPTFTQRPHPLPPTAAAQTDQARAALAASLRQYGDLASAVEQFEGVELQDVLNHIDALGPTIAESNQLLQSTLRNQEAAPEA